METALDYARQIAEALEAAHEKGITHRDLKPANIMITPAGTVKVLDFGLAAVTQPSGGSEGDPSHSPTFTIGATQAGMIMGTAAYMSPEQASGKPVDRRADIWSFGVVLWEMLTGHRLFSGETISHTLADVLKGELEFDQLPPQTPAAIRRLIRRCLDRNVGTRLQWIGEARVTIQKCLADPQGEAEVAPQAKARPTWWIAAMAVLVVISGALAWIDFRARPPEMPVTRSTILPPEKTSFSDIPPAVSPDGRRMVFSAQAAGGETQLWVRSLDDLAAQPLAGTQGGHLPFWSPGGKSIGFFAGGKLERIEASGGPPLALAGTSGNERGGTWNANGVILFAPDSTGPLMKISASGGAAEPITKLDTAKERSHRWPCFLPDGRHFLFMGFGGRSGTISVGSLDSPEIRPLMEAQSNAVYAPGPPEAYLLFMRGTTLVAQPFDAARLKLEAEAATPVAENIQASGLPELGAFSVSSSGTLVYAGGASAGQELTWVDRSGGRTVVGEPAVVSTLNLSPDDKYAAAGVFDPASRKYGIWLYDLARGLRNRFTSDPAQQYWAVWSPDGGSVVYDSHYDLYRRQSNGAGGEELLYADDLQKQPESWSPDGKFLLYTSRDPKTSADLWILPDPLGSPGKSKPYPFLRTEFSETKGQFSPDGKWIAYQSNETGRNEIYANPFPGPGGKRRISTGGGTSPRWRRDGREIFFIAPDRRLTAALVTAKGESIEVGETRPLFGPLTGSYDVSADGQRFLATVPQQQSASEPLTLVQNWMAGLKK
jgi:eukaryotic-like serine/threonine-protein kinase